MYPQACDTIRGMRRLLLPALLALVAAGCGAEQTVSVGPPPPRAAPRAIELGWRERYGPVNGGLVFVVRRLDVTEDGWTASVSVENRTPVPWRFDPFGHELGLLLLDTGDLRELERLGNAGRLPSPRLAETVTPPVPALLRPRETWTGEIGARGSLPSGSWARITFGPFTADGDPPKGMRRVVVWYTDHATRL